MKVKAKKVSKTEIVIRLNEEEAKDLYEHIPARPWNGDHNPLTLLEEAIRDAFADAGIDL